MRSLLPITAIVYLETNDLSKMLESITESPAFQTLVDEKPDFSFLGRMQIAVAITKISSSEQQINSETSAINFTPQFVAVAQTHLWSWQTDSFVKTEIDRFVRKNYGETAKLKVTEKETDSFYEWTAADNRQVFALIRGSLIYFGNDAAAIESCIAIKKGEASSLVQNESLTRAYSANNLAFGYISSAGIKEIGDLAGVSIAVEATEETSQRSFIARLLPRLLQNTTREIVWTANKTEHGIEDKFSVTFTNRVTSITKETLNPAPEMPSAEVEFLPPDLIVATRYNLQKPLLAWQSLLLMAAENSDELSGRFLIESSGSLLEPYRIINAESFLNSIDSEITTVQFDSEDEKTAVIVTVKDAENIKKAISPEINFKSEPEKKDSAEIWFAADKKSAAAFTENKLIFGESESVLKCLQAKISGENFIKSQRFRGFKENQSIAVTFGKDMESAEKIVNVLARKKDENRKLATFYSTETRITENGIERKTVSDFGLMGTILQQLNQ